MTELAILTVLSPLIAAIVAGLFGRHIGRTIAHTVTIIGVSIAFVCSVIIFWRVTAQQELLYTDWYTWFAYGAFKFTLGFNIDSLSATMLVVVNFVSLAVHVYAIGYMHDDDGYQRFFSYISLFTFFMLMLVLSNNFVQLFFGWEGVGLASYLLIGFWHKKPSAVHANLKAFLVNRVGDFGFLLGIALVLTHFGSLDFRTVFAGSHDLADQQLALTDGTSISLMTAICLLLFVGAMGKSAQVPLHVWLPDSMEGPTPISALIHAATMVTAGIFMVSRMSPLFELSDTALSVVMVIGAITALFMGLLGIVQNDIKRVVAYSTLSQLGYMTVALGASAYSMAMFHLVTHAFFKALLFLAAGSVIIAMHHDQDIRNMGGLAKKMPITWICSLIGTLALIGFPFLSGFYSKDGIILATQASTLPGSGFAYFSVLIGVFITAFYSLRVYFLVFHGQPRYDAHGHPPHESPKVVTYPLIALAIPSVFVGFIYANSIYENQWFGDAIVMADHHPASQSLAAFFDGAFNLGLHGFVTAPFYLMLFGVLLAWFCYLKRPDLPSKLQAALQPIHRLLSEAYFIDRAYLKAFAGGARSLGRGLWRGGDVVIIDQGLVHGVVGVVHQLGQRIKRLQTSVLYHYAFAMVVGIVLLTFWQMYR